MPSIRLTEEEIRYVALFEKITGITPRDTVIDDQYNRIIFVVDKNFAPLAVGKNGVNIRKLKELIGKDVEVVEYGETPEELIKNSLYPARVISVKITKLPNNGSVAIAMVHSEDKAIAIGKQGRNINRARLLAKRYFDIDKIKIISPAEGQ
ncbi:MAG: NusA-like transcription termination signal-binding factor [Vulcanisaeta sp.]|jgi:N utilization substance protein A|nr:NusA-like transcription termination signal-binding factor [Vulcanisaeta sp.]MCG2869183.1 NusA-like transcription termination signal-binding factor [Vulcanisaeta sp.]MCG2879838.1 NusA-like transcription termination signal-binding factor [Vulcanisaeta sp.]MCG2886544.1 NusA-like transcription termination signal-binding factor [Vulcanisaeta sp.]MCG2894816.1 NusA-like transcription termination signal-binding factor [Vulcanisaeta sp.]